MTGHVPGPADRIAPVAVVFDLDGVLIESEHLWEEMWTRYAARSGVTWTAEDTGHVQGMSAPEWADHLARRAGTGDAAEAERAVVDDMVEALEQGRMEPYDGAVVMVREVAERVPIALATSAARRLLDAVLARHRLDATFTATVSSAEVPRGKPSPDVYLEAAATARCRPRRLRRRRGLQQRHPCRPRRRHDRRRDPEPHLPAEAGRHGAHHPGRRRRPRGAPRDPRPARRRTHRSRPMTRVLAAGDEFVLPTLFDEALRAEPDVGDLDIAHLTSGWPHEPFGPVGPEGARVEEASGTEDDLVAALDGARVCLTQMAPFTARVFDAAPDLEMVAVSRGGPVNVDLAAADRAGVAVAQAPGRNAAAAAEYAVGMALAALRRIPMADRELRDGTWRGDLYAYDEAGLELDGTTVGLVGYGAIGRIVARVLRAFGATVLVADPYTDEATAGTDGVRLVGLDELLRSSSVVSLHARLSDETRGMIGARELDLLPRGRGPGQHRPRRPARLRAPLPEALRSGRLGGLALDVYDVEPPPDDWPLHHAPNVVATPHLAGATKQTAHRAASIAAGEVARFLRGEPLRHPANEIARARTEGVAS